MGYIRSQDGKLIKISYDPSQALELIRSNQIKFIDLQFSDLQGRLQHTTISARSLDLDIFTQGVPKLDGSSIKGFVEVHESDMVLKPDPSTFGIISWIPDHLKTARLICDIYWGYGQGRFSRDPRYIAQRAEEYLVQQGFDFSLWGPEVEFFVFDKLFWDVLNPFKGQSYRIYSREAPWDHSKYPIKFKQGYLPAPPQDTLMEFRSEIALILERDFGIPVEAHHHEVSTAGQGEIDMYRDTLTCMGDNVLTCKFAIKNLAASKDMVASFMPKPIYGDNGSGMHTHVSLWKDSQNAFYDPDDPYAELSQIGRYFVGGLLEHSKSLAGIVAPTTNSYKRLVRGYEAPVYITWGIRNRSSCVRIPVYHVGPEFSHLKRIEFRPPDPSCNPYLCFAGMLAAGLDGIRKKLDPGDPVDENVYLLTPERKSQLNIDLLPASLKEALQILETDRDYLEPIFPKDAIDMLIELGMQEAMEVESRPHPYEFHLYFDI